MKYAPIFARSLRDAPPVADSIILQIQGLKEEKKSAFRVILYNDDDHSCDEVVLQIQKATGFSLEKAEAIMLEAHTNGRAIVYCGELERCNRIAAVLGQIGLRVTVEAQ